MRVSGTGWVWKTGLAAAGLFAGMAVHAQAVRAADEIAVAPYEESYGEPPPAVVYREEETETYAEVPVRRPPPVEVEVLPPREVFAVVRERGFEPMGPARRHGPVYSISVLDPNGDDGRVMVDARTGRVVRFVRAYGRGEEIVVRRRPGRFGQTIEEPRYAPRPPVGVPYSGLRGPAPHMASRTPPAVPVPRPRHVTKAAVAKPAVAKATDKPAVDTAKPETATAKDNAAVTKPAETTATQASASVEPATVGAVQASVKPEAKPVEAKSAQVELKPTQDLPPVQPLD